MNLATLFANPILKTVFSAAVGGALVAVDAAVQNPSGGMLVALQSNPTYAAIFTIGALLVHNIASSATFVKKSS